MTLVALEKDLVHPVVENNQIGTVAVLDQMNELHETLVCGPSALAKILRANTGDRRKLRRDRFSIGRADAPHCRAAEEVRQLSGGRLRVDCFSLTVRPLNVDGFAGEGLASPSHEALVDKLRRLGFPVVGGNPIFGACAGRWSKLAPEKIRNRRDGRNAPINDIGHNENNQNIDPSNFQGAGAL